LSSWRVCKTCVDSDFTNTFFRRCLTNYWILPLLVVAGFYSGIRQKKFLQLLLVIVFIVAFFLSLSVTYHDFLPFYTESELMPGTIILSAPFVFFSLPRIRPKMAISACSRIFL